MSIVLRDGAHLRAIENNSTCANKSNETELCPTRLTVLVNITIFQKLIQSK